MGACEERHRLVCTDRYGGISACKFGKFNALAWR